MIEKIIGLFIIIAIISTVAIYINSEINKETLEREQFHRNMYKAYNRVCYIIESCTTLKHCNTCFSIIHRFDELFDDMLLTYDLRKKLFNKQRELLNHE